LNCLTVLLCIPEQDLAQRCLDRKNRSGRSWTKDMIICFGPPQAVRDAIIQSTRRRREGAQRSRLPLIEIEPGSGSWSKYADKIVEAWTALYIQPPNPLL